MINRFMARTTTAFLFSFAAFLASRNVSGAVTAGVVATARVVRPGRL